MCFSYSACASDSVVLALKPKLRVGLTLQRGQVVQQRAGLRGGLGLFRHRAGLAAHRIGNRLRLGLCPDAIRLQLGCEPYGIFDLLELRVEPLAVVTAGLDASKLPWISQ